MNIAQIIERGAGILGVGLRNGAGAEFEAYYDFLEKKGKKHNLTAITGVEDVTRLHFLDSLALLKTADFKNARVIDVGSGAGFPGVPLKLAEPSIELTLLDAAGKRVSFLRDLCAALGLAAAFVYARAEESAHSFEYRERFDIAASRAVARLNVLCELCLPFVRAGGVFLAMKSMDSGAELDEARGAIDALGAELEGVCDYSIPDTEISHRIIIIRKTSTTPESYPRRFAKIKKSPLISPAFDTIS